MNMGIEMDNLAFERDQLDGGMGAQLASGKVPGGGGEQTVTETVTTRQYQVSQQQQVRTVAGVTAATGEDGTRCHSSNR